MYLDEAPVEEKSFFYAGDIFVVSLSFIQDSLFSFVEESRQKPIIFLSDQKNKALMREVNIKNFSLEILPLMKEILGTLKNKNDQNKLKKVKESQNFKVGDYVVSRATPGWGHGVIVEKKDDQFMVTFSKIPDRLGKSAVRCHKSMIRKANIIKKGA